MDSNEYISGAIRTESPTTQALIDRITEPDTIRLSHAAYGMCTESAEFLDALKKHIYYGKKLDKTNLAEEIGDILWYIAIVLDTLGVDFETLMCNNLDKLKARYPDKFNKEDAVNRNLSQERKILEAVGLDIGSIADV